MFGECHSEERLFDQLKSNYQIYVQEREKNQQEIRTMRTEHQVYAQTMETKLRDSAIFYEASIGDHKKRIGELEDQCKKLQNQENDKNRRQIRKFIENINEKDAQIGNLRRQVTSYKSKISSLENEITNVNNMKDDLEIFIIKHLEQVKCNVKEAMNCIEEVETQKMVMESKFKQLNDKVEHLVQRIIQNDVKKKNIEENYNKLKNIYQASKTECISLKFQIQKIKQPKYNAILQQFDRPESLYPQLSQDSILKEIQSILELENLLANSESFLRQIADYSQLNRQLVEENNVLKIKISENELTIQNYMKQLIPGYEDELLKNKEPALFQYLQHKKQELVNFEDRLDKIEQFIQNNDQEIDKILTRISEKEAGCSCGKQAELQKIQKQFDTLSKSMQNLNQKAQKFKKQASTLQKTISLYKFQIKDLMVQNAIKGKGKRFVNKKRCFYCLFTIDKQQTCQNCTQCQKSYHKDCLALHECQTICLEEGMSYISNHDKY